MLSTKIDVGMSTFFDQLESRVIASSSLLCVGLDPHASQLSEVSAAAALAFCLEIVRATHSFAAAFKPNAAFFEALGAEGVEVLRKVIAAVPDGIPVILDAKRGDISSTAEAYATAAYDVYGAHSITLAPYMGWDSICPFVADSRPTKVYHNHHFDKFLRYIIPPTLTAHAWQSMWSGLCWCWCQFAV